MSIFLCVWMMVSHINVEEQANIVHKMSQALRKPERPRAASVSQEPWIAKAPGAASDGVACQMLDGHFPLAPAWDRWLPDVIRARHWRPKTSGGDDPTRFYPTRSQIKQDFYREDQSPYHGLKRFNTTEATKWASAYISSAEVESKYLERTLLSALGGPPNLMLEVGTFIGSAAVNIWGKLAQRKFGLPSDGSRLVICADTWQGALIMRLGSHPDVMSMKQGFMDIGTTFMRRVLSAEMHEEIWPLSFPSIGTARLLYLLGYKIDAIYVDSAHELGETLIELHMFYHVRPRDPNAPLA